MPKPQRAALAWAPTARWPTREAFWAEPLGERRVEMQAKYQGLLACIAQAPGVGRDRELRALAARWPGALREGQLAPLDEIRARLAALEGAIVADDLRRAGHPAVPLWAALHGLIGDLGVLRGSAPGVGVAGLSEHGRARWPEPGAWWSALAWPPDSSVARAWLAAVAGIDAIDAVLGRRRDAG